MMNRLLRQSLAKPQRHKEEGRRKLRNLRIIFLMSFLLIISCGPAGSYDEQLQAMIVAQHIEPLSPIPAQNEALVTLGRNLYFDNILSGNKDVSCATCHLPAVGTGDGLPLSIGTGGVNGLGPERELGNGRSLVPRNAPDVFNRGAVEWTTMFWDGRVAISPRGYYKTPQNDDLPGGLYSLLAAQAMFPVTSVDEMRGSPGDTTVTGELNELALIPSENTRAMWDRLMARLLSIPEYEALFAAAYPDVPTSELGFQHAANAIGAFEAEAFACTNNPWHAYLNGDLAAISDDAKKGALLFYGEAGCVTCHAGALFTDQTFHNIATPQLGPGKGNDTLLDNGRFLETGRAEDQFAFRTPSLLNVTATGPWLHNGAYNDLTAVINHHQNPEAALKNYDPTAHLPAYLHDTVQNHDAVTNALLASVDAQLAPTRKLSPMAVQYLIAFLETLTDPTVYEMEDMAPTAVPSGLPVLN
ncbi:MAG: cytochrome-c peroxidase [Anaerolineae bacterium]|nr:cytochrome-c peroxidase [Anaerolineae bacterium]